MWRDGRVWLIAAVLKTADLVMSGVRGFESLSRRQNMEVAQKAELYVSRRERVKGKILSV